MIALLQSVLCVLMQIPYFVVWAAITAFNAVILAIAAIIVPLVSLMPAFPDLPTMPSEFTTVMGWINWFFPVGTVVSILTFAVAVYVAWFIIVIGLRWAKATDV